MDKGTLFVVATPIGNREDLSPRALRVLGEADLIASEDTRRTGRLLSHFGISRELIALHEHNESEAAGRVVSALESGRCVALVSDAGTPLISDPGFRLLSLAHARGLTVSPVPGPSALLAALSVAGLPTDRFCFEGFLPAKAAARRRRLAELATATPTLIFYEAVHRVGATLADLVESFGAERQAFLGRELSKLHEQCMLAPLATLAARFEAGTIPAKGEFVLVVAGAARAAPGARLDLDELLRRLEPLMPRRQAIDIAAAVSGERRNDVYRRMLAISGESPADGA